MSAALRQQRFRHDTRLTRREVLIAYRVYREGGLSVPAIAAQVWERYEYANPKSCEDALYRWFKTLGGCPTRDDSTAALLERRQRPCRGCGCDLGERTEACRACISRHWRRRKLGLPYVEAPNQAMRRFRVDPELA